MVDNLKILIGLGAAFVFSGSAYLGYETVKRAPLQSTQSTEPSVPITKKMGPWNLICRADKDLTGSSCAATRRVIDPHTKKPMFVWTIGYDKDGEFLNVFRGGNRLKSGMPVIVSFEDKTKFSANNTMCDQRYCEYLLEMSDTFIAKLNESANISFTLTSSIGKNLIIDIAENEMNSVVESVKR